MNTKKAYEVMRLRTEALVALSSGLTRFTKTEESCKEKSGQIETYAADMISFAKIVMKLAKAMRKSPGEKYFSF